MLLEQKRKLMLRYWLMSEPWAKLLKKSERKRSKKKTKKKYLVRSMLQ